MIPEQAVTTIMQKVGPPTAMFGGSGVAIWFGKFSVNEIAALCGVIIALGGFLVNWYYKHKQWKLYEKLNSNKRRHDDPSPTAPGALNDG